jgi:protein-tyrosine phosphatase
VRSLGRGRAVVAPLLQFARSTTMREVPDPYYAGGFDRVYEMIFDGCEGLLAHIRHEHQL